MRWSTMAGLATVAAGAVGASWLAASDGHDNYLDTFGARWRRPRGHAFDRVTGWTTDIGSVYGVAGAAAALAVTASRRLGLDVAGSGATAWIAAQVAKPSMSRQRPYEVELGELLVHTPAGSSWPSGHTAVASAVATTVARQGPTSALTGIATAAWVGWSRIYVGAHHPSDIVAGFGIGALSAVAWHATADRLLDRLEERRRA